LFPFISFCINLFKNNTLGSGESNSKQAYCHT
jgi:hypothetical protein